MNCKSLTAFRYRKQPPANWNLHASGVAALGLLGLLALSSPVQAQLQYEQPGSKYYVWGQVHAPGAYSFVASPDLLELLSASGGPTNDANLKRVLLIRAVTKKRTRIDLQAMLTTGQVVRLSPGDVVIVPSTPWYRMRDALSILTTAAGFVTLYFTLEAYATRQ
jgi:protein involved in polysaccharide export with SLBB domain